MSNVMKVYACLHMHSTHSDGAYTPDELARVGDDEGYRALVLTDHDTVSGTEEMIEACRKRGLECMLGIEFSTVPRERGRHFHITAFHFDPEYPEMKDYLEKLSEKETDQTRLLFERGIDIGYIKGITWEEVLEFNKGITWLCNEHVFRAMKAKGLISDLDYPEFFATCFGKYRSQVPPKYDFMATEDLISLVHRAGGIAFVAHPTESYGSLDDIRHLHAKYGLDGIEVWHGDLSIEERKEALKLARELDLYVSGGPDHSGLLGGEYARYENPEDTIYYFPPLTLGTTKYFYEEIRDNKKKPDRLAVMDELLANSDIWVTTGGKDRRKL